MEKTDKLETIKKMTNCVEMSGITQPLFSNYPYGTEDDEPHYDYSGPQDKFESFNSVFKFDTSKLFEQPDVPKDLSSFVSQPQPQEPVVPTYIEMETRGKKRKK